jgi:hypothetical protein
VDLGPTALGQLQRGDADTARSRVDEDALARAQRAVAVERRPRRGVDDRDRGALLERQALGQRDQVGCGDHDLRGVAAEGRPRHDALADALRVDAVTDRSDGARHLVAHDARGLRGVGIEADARERVGEVDPGGAHVDAHLPRSGRRLGTLLHLQDVQAAVLGDDHRAHGDEP